MVRVNYSDIASRYDNNPIRGDIAPDQLLQLAKGAPWKVLDVGCGTGSYIEKQAAANSSKNITWHGVDPNEDMLTLAKAKAPFAKFYAAKAENLPFSEECFDYVTSRFSFHHFSDRKAAIKEVYRVLKPGGFLKIVNLVPELSPNWWVFRYFPEAKKIDEQRFWTLQQLKVAIASFGFKIRDSHLNLCENIRAELILNEVRNRETSELLLISDATYRAGLIEIERDLEQAKDQLVHWGLMIAELTFIKPDIRNPGE